MEKMDAQPVTEQMETHAAGSDNVHVEVIRGSEALVSAIRKEKPKPFTRRMIQLYLCCCVAFLCSTMNGFDGSLLGSIQTLDSFKHQMGSDIVGEKIGLISGMYTIGGVCALPFVGPAVDTYGRRFGMFIGCFFVVIGTIISATAPHVGQFMGGRFLLGFGVSIAASAGPAYVVEISPPQYRGVITGLYNCQYYVGSITAAGATRGCLKYDSITSNKAWQIPVWCQMIASGIVVIFAFLLPESPRWLYSHGKHDACLRVLTKYHGEGREDSELVRLQIREYEEAISKDGSDKRPWDYRDLFNSPSNRFRVYNMLIPSVFGQWSGNGVVSYYLPAMLKTAGITSNVQILNINLGNAFTSAFGAYLGASFVQRLGRRPMLIGVCIGCSIIFACITIGTGLYDTRGYPSAGTAGIVFIFFFGIIYSFGWTPLQALYPVEVLSYEQRAKGMALSSVAVNAAALLNQFAWPVALGNIGWHTYIIFIVWDLIQAAVCWFMAVETNGRTLEELSEIYASKNPVKASLLKKEVVVDDTKGGEIVEVKGIVGIESEGQLDAITGGHHV